MLALCLSFFVRAVQKETSSFSKFIRYAVYRCVLFAEEYINSARALGLEISLRSGK